MTPKIHEAIKSINEGLKIWLNYLL
jgi:hypothetical protein